MPGGSAHRAASVWPCLRRFCEPRAGGRPPWAPEVVEAFVVVGLAGRAPRPRAPTARCCARSGARARPALATPFGGSPGPKRPTALKKERSYSPWPPPSARRGGEPRPWHCWCSASGPGCGPASWPPPPVTTSSATEGRGQCGWAGGGRARRPRRRDRTPKPLPSWPNEAGPGYLFCPGGADRAYKNFVNNFCYHLEADPAAPRLSSAAGPVQFHLRPPGGRHTFAGTALYKRHC